MLAVGGCTRGSLVNAKNAQAPVIDRVIPSEGVYLGGTQIAIIGKGFSQKAEVYLGASPCARAEMVSETTLICTTTSHPVSQVDVSVVNPNRKVAMLKKAFAFVDALGVAPGFAITAGGGISASPSRRANVSLGEPGVPILQSSASRRSISGVQATGQD